MSTLILGLPPASLYWHAHTDILLKIMVTPFPSRTSLEINHKNQDVNFSARTFPPTPAYAFLRFLLLAGQEVTGRWRCCGKD